jgi:hypothetical protein
MFDLTVLARGARWLLLNDDGGELGDFASPAEALRAAQDYEAASYAMVRHVLVQVDGEWAEVAVEPGRLH